ncbi:MAG: hypothetical protein JSU07_14240 [Bacteroidetes bacterium]|nr:hypothetical protein [Bacteroidota bacterium]
MKDCRDTSQHIYLSELVVFKNNNLFKTINPQLKNTQFLSELDTGTYIFQYKTIFDTEEKTKLNISENKKYTLLLCVNYIDYSKNAFTTYIDQLKENESYSISIASDGCFHSTKDLIKIKREKNNYYINWGEKLKILTKENVLAIKYFEIELNHLLKGFCTTQDTYTISYKETKKIICDGSCNWKGAYYLHKQLFEK